MQVNWVITDADVTAVRNLVRDQAAHQFVLERQRKNVDLWTHPRLDKPHVWKRSLACMLSSQQRSGPGSALHAFLKLHPFPLTYVACRKNRDDLAAYALAAMRSAGGIRQVNRRSQWIEANFLDWFEGSGWSKLHAAATELLGCRRQKADPVHSAIERKAAAVAAQLDGFGPKQSRNLWQTLGLTRYEIPLDSRLTTWLNANVLDAPLSGAGLADETYYRHIMGAIQALCARADVLPCIFDAAVFSLGNPDWPVDAEIW